MNMTNFSSPRFPNHGYSERFPECGVFGHIVELWHDKNSEFDEEAYNAIFTQIKPEHLIEFLHATFCVFESSNRFLVDALKLAQDHGWDT